MKTRTFVAMSVSSQIRFGAKQAAARLRSASADVRWVDPDNLHYTFCFLGDITDQQIAQVCHSVACVAARHEPFALEAVGLGAFPAIERPRTLWIGAGPGGERLSTLQADSESALAELGFRGENRRYVPHLTIGRLVHGARSVSPQLAAELSSLSDFQAGAMTASEVTVFASQLSPAGPQYHVLSKAQLGSSR